MKVMMDVCNGFDIAEVLQWLTDFSPSFVSHRFVEGDDKVELRLQDYPWFRMEIEFSDEQDATMFLLRWK